MKNSNDFIQLNDLYNTVGQRFLLEGNVTMNELQSSRNIFLADTLATRKPRPKALETVAVVSGLPFTIEFRKKIKAIQLRIQEIIGDTLSYWVDESNLGVELFIVKWPEQEFDLSQFSNGNDCLRRFERSPFCIKFHGIQIHRDGCVIARGFDEKARIREFRASLIQAEKIPSRQSNWSHVPLGRILEPFTDEAYEELINYVQKSQQECFHTENIKEVKMVHERRWYMEEVSTIKSLALSSVV